MHEQRPDRDDRDDREQFDELGLPGGRHVLDEFGDRGVRTRTDRALVVIGDDRVALATVLVL